MSTNTTTLSPSGGQDPGDALACLEEYLSDCLCGGVGMIHAPRSVASKWQENGLIRREGPLLLTVNDTIVVPDGGYRGLAPLGVGAPNDLLWAYATSPIYIRLGPIVTIPDSFNDAVDHLSNTVEYRAQRFAAAYWDGCCAAGIGVQIERCQSIGS